MYPKWKDHYVSYKELREEIQHIKTQRKGIFYTAINFQEISATEHTRLLQTQKDPRIEQFIQMFAHDVEAVHTFFDETWQHYEHELDGIIENIQEREEIGYEFSMGDTGVLRDRLITLYRQMEFLYSFLHMNRIAIRDLRDRFCEAIGDSEETCCKQVQDFTQNNAFDSSDIKRVMERTENLYALLFTGNDHQKALYSLRQPNTKYGHTDTFKLAFCMGIVFTCIILIIIAWLIPPVTIDFPVRFSKNRTHQKQFFDVFPVFRGILLFIVYIWLYGIDLYVWVRHRINHVYLFEFDPNNNLDHVRVFKTVSVVSVIWAVCFLLYLTSLKWEYAQPKYFPLVLTLTMIFIVILPLHAFHMGARVTLLKTLLHLFITPFGFVRFREVFTADILTSMVVPITDTSYILCYFFSNAWNKPTSANKCMEWNKYSGPALTCIPFVWRLLQCARTYYFTKTKVHLYNAGKYCTALMVILFNTLHVTLEKEDWGPYRYVWIVFVIISTLYSFCWDIIMDWGLLVLVDLKPKKEKEKEEEDILVSYTVRKNHSLDKFFKKVCCYRIPRLREKLFYSTYSYYLGAIFNFFARFAWAGTISTFSNEKKEFLKIMFGTIELVRRCSWSFFRLEWAMISNNESYRKQRTVPFLPPTESLGLGDKTVLEPTIKVK